MFQSHIQPRRPLARTLAIGVPWLAVVGLLAGAEYVRNEGTITRGLLQFFSGSCPSQIAGVELPKCAELDSPLPEFPVSHDPALFTFVAGQLKGLELLDEAAPAAGQVYVAPTGQTVWVERSEEVRLAIEAARAEVEDALAIARTTCRESQELRSGTSIVLRRSPRPDTEAPAMSVRVSTDG